MVQWAELSALNSVFGALGTTTDDLEHAIASVADVLTTVASEVEP